MLDAVTMGEVIVQFNPVTTVPLRHITYFEKHAAGAEANFAIGGKDGLQNWRDYTRGGRRVWEVHNLSSEA